MKIEDGTGTGNVAQVDNANRIQTKAVIIPLRHHVSGEHQDAFQVSADIAIVATEQNLLLIKNTSNEQNLIVSYIRVEAAGAAAAGIDAYFNVKVGGDYASGGTAVVATNVFVGSAHAAEGEFYDAQGSAIVTSGTFTQIDRTYQDNNTYRKDDSIVIPKNASLLISHKGSTAVGQAYCRISFYFSEEEH